MENWTDRCKKMKLDHLLMLHTRFNSKWIKNFNVRLKSIKTLEENTGSKISDIAHSNILSDISSQARETKGKNKQMGLHETKIFCTGKESISKRKTQHTERHNIFTDTPDKG